MPSLGGWEWVILAVVALVLFGGARIAGLGKGAGRAIREFKEETSSLRAELGGAARLNPDNEANTD
jgi:sec-independent protein translocase protein TatA